MNYTMRYTAHATDVSRRGGRNTAHRPDRAGFAPAGSIPALIVLVGLALTMSVGAQTPPSAEEIVRRLEENRTYETSRFRDDHDDQRSIR